MPKLLPIFEIAMILRGIYRHEMTRAEFRVAGILIDIGYCRWAEDGQLLLQENEERQLKESEQQ